MAGQVVENDHVAGLQGRGELALDVEVEEVTVDRAVDNPGRIEPVVALSLIAGVFALAGFLQSLLT